eukprot:2642121-Amphidinium_carterae.1
MTDEVRTHSLGGVLYSLLGLKPGSLGQSIRMLSCCTTPPSSSNLRAFGILPIPTYLTQSMDFDKAHHDWVFCVVSVLNWLYIGGDKVLADTM